MYYVLSTAYTRRKGQLSYTDNRYTVESCEVCNGNFVNYSEPINFEIKGKICDFYSFDNINIISQKFLEVLKESRITGYEIRSAECLNLNSVAEKPVKYYEMIITGRCGLICNMDFELLPHCSVCGRRLQCDDITHGVMFDDDNWDKSDIFAFNNISSLPIVTEELKNLLIKAKLVNLKFTELSNYDVFY